MKNIPMFLGETEFKFVYGHCRGPRWRMGRQVGLVNFRQLLSISSGG